MALQEEGKSGMSVLVAKKCGETEKKQWSVGSVSSVYMPSQILIWEYGHYSAMVMRLCRFSIC